MARLRLFAAAREAAGRGSDDIDAPTIAAVLEQARARYGPAFGDVLRTCRVWCNGEEVDADHPVGDDDEIAVLPPVSGGF